MKVTEVRVKLVDDPDNRLRAFCSITIDNLFVIRDLKVIEGPTGRFVAMPSRKLTVQCKNCGVKNPMRAAYCNRCGKKQPLPSKMVDRDGRTKEHADIVHPINSDCREMIQSHILAAYTEERELSRAPGYKPRFDDVTGEDQAKKSRRVDSRQTAAPEGPTAPPSQPRSSAKQGGEGDR